MKTLLDGEDSAVVERIQHLKHHPQWDEVICQALASVPPERAASLIRQAILVPESRYEKWLFRDLHLASRCLARHPDQAALSPLRDQLALRLLPLVLKTGPALHFDADTKELTWTEGNKSLLAGHSLDFFPDLRTLVWEMLIALNSEAVKTALVANGKSQYVDTRFPAAEALAKLGAPRGITALLAVCMDKDSDTDVYRFSAVEVLGELGKASPKVLDTLLAFCQDRDEEINVRHFSVKALRKLGDRRPQTITALISLLDDTDLSLNALHALAELGVASGIAALEQLCSNTEALVAEWQERPRTRRMVDDFEDLRTNSLPAAELLGKRGNAVGLAALAALCADSGVQANIRLLAAEILAQHGDEKAVQTLVALSRQAKPHLRLAVAKALEALGKAEGTVALRELCQIPEGEARCL